MTEASVRELTSAEAGFLYALRRTGESETSHWGVDEVAARPLADVVEEGPFQVAENNREFFEAARIRSRVRRRPPVRRDRVEEVIRQGLSVLDEADGPKSVPTHLARKAIRRILDEWGGDVSMRSRRCFDLREWFDELPPELVGLRLVILGAALVGRLDRISVRRRLAGMLKDLPPSVADDVQSALERMPPLDDGVARRVFEVYGHLASRDLRSDDEFALLGLYFAVSAVIFRQNRLLGRFEKALSDPMVRWCRKYRRACLRSRKPELSPAIAETVASVFGDRTGIRESTDGSRGESSGGEDE